MILHESRRRSSFSTVFSGGRLASRPFAAPAGSPVQASSPEARTENARRFGHSLDHLRAGAAPARAAPSAVAGKVVQRTRGQVRFVQKGVSYTPEEESEREEGGALRREQEKIEKQPLFINAVSDRQRREVKEEQGSLLERRLVSGRDHGEIARSVKQQAETNRDINSRAKLPTRLKVQEVQKSTELLDKHIASLGGESALKAQPLVKKRDEILKTLKTLKAMGSNELGHLPFASHLPNDPIPSGEQHLLQSENLNKTYEMVGEQSANSTVPHGRYAFAVRHAEPGKVYLGQAHHKLAEGKEVSYAGEAHFEKGKLTRWNNATGHYKTHPGFAHQAESATSEELGPPLLSRETFRPHHIDALRKEKLTALAAKLGKSALAAELGISEAELAPVLKELDVPVLRS